MLTLIIPHFNDQVHLIGLIQSIERELRSTPGAEIQVLLMDDGSRPDCREALAAMALHRFPWLTLHFLEKNQGPAVARNTGASLASTEWIWFLDADVVLCENALAQALKILEKSEQNDVIITSVSSNPLASKGYARHKAYLNYFWQPDEGRTGTLDSKSFLIRRKVFLENNGFDSHFKTASVEDYELGFRLLKGGARLYFTRKVVVAHNEPSFATQLKIYFDRSSRWIKLKRSYGMRFDDNGSTPREAAAQLLAFSVLVFALIGFAELALVLLLAFTLLNLQRLLFMRKKGEPLVFLAAHLFYGMVSSVPILLGSLHGLWKRQ